MNICLANIRYFWIFKENPAPSPTSLRSATSPIGRGKGLFNTLKAVPKTGPLLKHLLNYSSWSNWVLSDTGLAGLVMFWNLARVSRTSPRAFRIVSSVWRRELST